MKDELKKFQELLLTDEAFRGKLKTALEAYDGEKTEEAVFQNVLVPVAAEYGIKATYEEYKADMVELQKSMDDKELSMDEINNVAGGRKSTGLGVNLCFGAGIGVGSTDGSLCVGVGAGGGSGACWVDGVDSGFTSD